MHGTDKPMQSELYLFGSNKIEVLPYFLYEVTVYELSKNMARLLASSYYKTDRELTINKVIPKKYRNKLYIKNIDLLGAPFDFIKENKLKKYQPIKRKKI